jgi:hypothetical protein
VVFRGATSIVAVCSFCHSTLLREGAKLENIGKQAELLEDASPIQLGTEGQYHGARFAVVGRVQYRYAAGTWNEWHCLFDDGRTAWLSDAMGTYIFTFLRPPQTLPALAELQVGREVRLEGEPYEVADIERAHVIAGAGELPFKVGSGYEAVFVDLRGAYGRFATVDFSETPPLLYAGEVLPFESFRFANLRDEHGAAAPTARAVAFNCPSCGAPLEKRVATTEAIGCASCGAVVDVSDPKLALLSRALAERHTPTIPLGTKGKFEGVVFEVVGFMRREMKVEGETYGWDEYLLHNVEQGYRWIVQSQGHFSFVKAAANPPRVVNARPPYALYLGRRFRHFQGYSATVAYVLGEFYWRVAVGDVAWVNDYVAPPLILSSERSENEITWSLGEYVEPAVLWGQLGLKNRPPPRIGVAPNQPSPQEGKVLRYWSAFAMFALAALVLQVAFALFADTRIIHSERFQYTPGRGPQTVITAPFEIRGARAQPIAVRSVTNANNSWVYLDMTLIEKDTGRTYRLGREVSYYYGSSGGDSWSEGSNDDRARIAALPPGTYYMEIEASGASSGRPVAGQVQVFRDPPDWTNLVLVLGALMLVPIGAWWRSAAFEKRRWAESDYAPTSKDDDDD